MGFSTQVPGRFARWCGMVSVMSLLVCAGVGLNLSRASASLTHAGLSADEPSAEPGTPAQPATGSSPGTNKPPVNEPVIDVKKQAQKPRPGQVMPGDGGGAGASSKTPPAKPAAPATTTPPAQSPAKAQTPTPADASTPTKNGESAKPVTPTPPLAAQAPAPSSQPPAPVAELPRLRPIVVNRPASAKNETPAPAAPVNPPAPESTQTKASPAPAPAQPESAPAMMKPIERITPEPIERTPPAAAATPTATTAPASASAPTPASAPVTTTMKSQPKVEEVHPAREPEFPRMQPVQPEPPVSPAPAVPQPAKVEPKPEPKPESTPESKRAEPAASDSMPTSKPTNAPAAVPNNAPAAADDTPLSRLRQSVVVTPVSVTVESLTGLVQWRKVDTNPVGDEGWTAAKVGEVIAGQIEVRTGPLSDVTLRSNEGEVLTLRRLSRVRVTRLEAPSDESGVRAASRLTAELSRGRMTATPALAVISTEKNAGVRSAIPSRRNAVSVLVDGSLVLAREATEISLDARGLSVRNVEGDAPSTIGK